MDLLDALYRNFGQQINPTIRRLLDRKDREILTIDRLPVAGSMGRNGSVVICFDNSRSVIIDIVNGHIGLVKGRTRMTLSSASAKNFKTRNARMKWYYQAETDPIIPLGISAKQFFDTLIYPTYTLNTLLISTCSSQLKIIQSWLDRQLLSLSPHRSLGAPTICDYKGGLK